MVPGSYRLVPAKTKPRLSVRAFKSRFDTDEKCREFREAAVWGDAPACRHGGALKIWRIKGKSARPGLIRCGERRCGEQSTVTVGTVFHATHLPLTTWFLAIYLPTPR